MRIKQILETGADQYPLIVFIDVHRAITVMYIEVQDGDAIDLWIFKCDGRGYRDTVEDAKAHGLGDLSVMAGRPDCTEGGIETF